MSSKIHSNLNSPMDSQSLGNSFYGLQSMSAESEAVRGLLAALTEAARGAGATRASGPGVTSAGATGASGASTHTQVL